jgi:hypothetical protein
MAGVDCGHVLSARSAISDRHKEIALKFIKLHGQQTAKGNPE